MWRREKQTWHPAGTTGPSTQILPFTIHSLILLLLLCSLPIPHAPSSLPPPAAGNGDTLHGHHMGPALPTHVPLPWGHILGCVYTEKNRLHSWLLCKHYSVQQHLLLKNKTKIKPSAEALDKHDAPTETSTEDTRMKMLLCFPWFSASSEGGMKAQGFPGSQGFLVEALWLGMLWTGRDCCALGPCAPRHSFAKRPKPNPVHGSQVAKRERGQTSSEIHQLESMEYFPVSQKKWDKLPWPQSTLGKRLSQQLYEVTL